MSDRDYDMGRVDERGAVDPLLADIEKSLSERSSIDETLSLLARVRDYRSKTERCLRDARALGWFT